jgi:NADH-quinone oxidoreductase subunit J
MIWLLFIMLTVGLLSSAIMVLYQKNPVYSALFLILAFLFLAGFYLMLGAEFIAFSHVIVYAGAIMVLFLFVIMLLNLREDIRGFVQGQGRIFFGLFAGGIVCLLLLVFLAPGRSDSLPGDQVVRREVVIEPAGENSQGETITIPQTVGETSETPIGRKLTEAEYRADNIQSVGQLLYSGYLLPFEIASVLLIVAMIGAVVLAKKNI